MLKKEVSMLFTSASATAVVESLVARIETLCKQLEGLQGVNGVLVEDNKGLRRDVDALSGINKMLKEKNREGRWEDARHLRDRIKRLDAEIGVLRGKLTDAGMQLDRMESVRMMNSSLLKKNDKLFKRVAELRRSNDTFYETVDALRKDRKEQEATIESLQCTIEHQRHIIDQLLEEANKADTSDMNKMLARANTVVSSRYRYDRGQD